MTFVSYAQNYEDVALHRALSDIQHGFYVDVGAQDPIADSVTRAFYERGWSGINVEPVKEWFDKLVSDRPRDINLQVAVSDRPGPLVIREVVGTGMSTTNAEYASRHRAAGFEIVEHEVAARTLNSILEEHRVQAIHFLKIDVEGAEADVLRSVDLDKYRPWIILLEATEPNSTTPTHEDWESLLLAHSYSFAWFDGLNRFYVAREHFERLAPRLAIPPNFFDDFIRYADLLAREERRNLEKQLADEREEERTRLKELTAQLDTANSEKLAASVEAAAARSEVTAVFIAAAALVQQLASATSKLALLESRVVDQDRTLEELRSEATVLKADLKHLRLENERLASLITSTRRNVDAARSLELKLRDAAEAAGNARRELAELRTAQIATAEALQAVLRSRSWRMTAPVRRVGLSARAAVRKLMRFLIAIGWSPEAQIRVAKRILSADLFRRFELTLQDAEFGKTDPLLSLRSKPPGSSSYAELFLRASQESRREWSRLLESSGKRRPTGRVRQ